MSTMVAALRKWVQSELARTEQIAGKDTLWDWLEKPIKAGHEWCQFLHECKRGPKENKRPWGGFLDFTGGTFSTLELKQHLFAFSPDIRFFVYAGKCPHCDTVTLAEVETK